jgi:hypothetical protein
LTFAEPAKVAIFEVLLHTVRRDVEVAEIASGFFCSGEYLQNAFHQRKWIHRIEHLLIDDIPTGSYPAGITPFNLQTCRQFPSITS